MECKGADVDILSRRWIHGAVLCYSDSTRNNSSLNSSTPLRTLPVYCILTFHLPVAPEDGEKSAKSSLCSRYPNGH